MRALAALLVLVVSLPAGAHPVRIDDLDDDFDLHRKGGKPTRPRKQPPPPPPPCPRTTSWSKWSRCQFKQMHVTGVEVLHDLPAAKLIAYPPGPGYGQGTKRLELYVLANGWNKAGFYAETNASTELIAFHDAGGGMYRMVMGYATPTWVTLDEVTTRPAMLRRQYTYFCSLTQGCRTVMTACDVLVHGKAVSTFRGVPKMNGTQLEVSGDGRNTNRYCTRPPNLIEVSD